jgi:hypothetical protein
VEEHRKVDDHRSSYSPFPRVESSYLGSQSLVKNYRLDESIPINLSRCMPCNTIDDSVEKQDKLKETEKRIQSLFGLSDQLARGGSIL